MSGWFHQAPLQADPEAGSVAGTGLPPTPKISGYGRHSLRGAHAHRHPVQRGPTALAFGEAIAFDEPICRLVAGHGEKLWNNDWISSPDLRAAVESGKIVNAKLRDEIAPVIPLTEVELFLSKAAEGYY